MSAYLILSDKSECPKCRHKHGLKSIPDKCRCCGMQLFLAENPLRRFEQETGLREYWVWTGVQYGWKHRSQIFSAETSRPIDSTPLSREYKSAKLDDDYGTPEMIKRRLDNSRIELKAELKKRKKKGVTVRKIR